MRIALIGQAAFGEAVFNALREKGYQIAGVCAPATAGTAKPDPLRAAAAAAGLPVLPTRRLRRDEAVRQQYLDLNADLNVMAFVTDIIPDSVLEAPALGTIQYHPSLLPLHRGASAIAWAIIQGDESTGLSIFWPDAGLDTGPILLQREVPIGPDDTVTTLYFQRLFPMGVEAMVESVEYVQRGDAPRTPQEHDRATYEPILRDEHTWIDWSRDTTALYALIRGANPSPGANALLRDQQIKVFDTARAAGSGAPGEVISVGDDGVVVATGDGALLLKRVQEQGGPKVAASAWATAAGVKAGDRFESRAAAGP